MTHVYALFEDEKDYTEAYREAEEGGLLVNSDNLKTMRSIEDEDDIPFRGTSMVVEILAYALGGLALGIVVGFILARMPIMNDLPRIAVVMLTSAGFAFFGFLAGIFTGASRPETHRQRLWQAFQPGNLAVLLDVKSTEAGEQIANVFTRHRARLVDVV